jgi:hypothetical protein
MEECEHGQGHFAVADWHTYSGDNHPVAAVPMMAD